MTLEWVVLGYAAGVEAIMVLILSARARSPSRVASSSPSCRWSPFVSPFLWIYTENTRPVPVEKPILALLPSISVRTCDY
ncbi:hypothetical protein GQ457_03G010980 [Hibiscus cannabinus]